MQPQPSPVFWHGRCTLVLLGFVTVLGYFLVIEYTAHTIAVLHWRFLLAPPGMDLMSHNADHLRSTLFSLQGNPHLGVLHIARDLVIGGGFILLAWAWRALSAAQTPRRLTTTGAYAYLRRPQYVAFIAIMPGFLLQWPMLLTLVMLAGPVAVHVFLARQREAQAHQAFSAEYDGYPAIIPVWIQGIGRRPFGQWAAQ